MSPGIARRVVTLFQKVRPPESAEHNLDEVRLLQLPAEGHSWKTGANKLDVTPNTIRFHMKRIYEKLSHFLLAATSAVAAPACSDFHERKKIGRGRCFAC
jgi:DNA-binding CsgD family transcriptional regulator